MSTPVSGASPRTALRGTSLPTHHPDYLLPAGRNISLANWAPAVHKKRKITNIIGIGTLKDGSIDRPSSIEFTEGHANIVFPFDICLHEGSNVDAMWELGSSKDGITSTRLKGELQPRVWKKCGKTYKLQENTQRQLHLTSAKA